MKSLHFPDKLLSSSSPPLLAKSFSRISLKHCSKLTFCCGLKYCFTKSLPRSTLLPTVGCRKRSRKIMLRKPQGIKLRHLSMMIVCHGVVHQSHFYVITSSFEEKISCHFGCGIFKNKTHICPSSRR